MRISQNSFKYYVNLKLHNSEITVGCFEPWTSCKSPLFKILQNIHILYLRFLAYPSLCKNNKSETLVVKNSPTFVHAENARTVFDFICRLHAILIPTSACPIVLAKSPRPPPPPQMLVGSYNLPSSETQGLLLSFLTFLRPNFFSPA